MPGSLSVCGWSPAPQQPHKHDTWVLVQLSPMPGFRSWLEVACHQAVASGRPLLRTDEHAPVEAAYHAMLARHSQQIQGNSAEEVPEAQLMQLVEHTLSNLKCRFQVTCCCGHLSKDHLFAWKRQQHQTRTHALIHEATQ